ncbi:MAG TPA: hypothetical protein VN714_06955 [Trebonia sp.]|jgi:hypothetical protein|nr:hypothetical protein [Trebonia sp.]
MPKTSPTGTHPTQYRGLGEEPYMPLDLTGLSDVMYDFGTPDPATAGPRPRTTMPTSS